jgi:hypothetical protein
MGSENKKSIGIIRKKCHIERQTGNASGYTVYRPKFEKLDTKIA